MFYDWVVSFAPAHPILFIATGPVTAISSICHQSLLKYIRNDERTQTVCTSVPNYMDCTNLLQRKKNTHRTQCYSVQKFTTTKTARKIWNTNGTRISRTATLTTWYEDARTTGTSVSWIIFDYMRVFCVGSPVTLLCGRSRYFWYQIIGICCGL